MRKRKQSVANSNKLRIDKIKLYSKNIIEVFFNQISLLLNWNVFGEAI